MAEDKPIPPPPQTDFVPAVLVTPSAKQHGEYAAKWLQDNPDHPHRVFVERIRDAAESHPEMVTEEIVRFIEAMRATKKLDGDQGAQEIPNLP
ncbi:MAG: hypothetical protein WCA21_15525 [Terracidiphilus sp.]